VLSLTLIDVRAEVDPRAKLWASQASSLSATLFNQELAARNKAHRHRIIAPAATPSTAPITSGSTVARISPVMVAMLTHRHS
jgi:hypothetical protein